ncbi:MAG: hypothetical protein HC904_16565 [Blastochloris sp.]|nr:hypothetical protein [Blastochloris sp.]
MLIHHAVDADWSVVVRRIMETVGSLFFPWLVILFIPMIFCAPLLFKWMSIEVGEDVLLDHKRALLNLPWFWGKAVLYFAYFCFATWFLRHLSIKQDASGDPGLTLQMRKLSYGFIPLFAVLITFAFLDWIMGLNHHWYSTMFGVYLFAGTAGGGIALTILIGNALRAGGHLKGIMTVEHNHIMGKLLLAFTIFWAYTAFSQYMLIYYANIPEETVFFLHRNTNSWHWVSIFLVFGHFFIPFILLLTQPAKRNPLRIAFVSIWFLFMHYVDLYWLIMPQLQIFKAIKANKGDQLAEFLYFSPHLLDVLIFAGMFCVLAYGFLRRFSKSSIFPLRDPRLYESVTLTN